MKHIKLSVYKHVPSNLVFATSLFTIDGRKQNEPDFDFHITPCLTFSTSDPNQKGELGGMAYAIAVEWGYWAFGIAYFKLNK